MLPAIVVFLCIYREHALYRDGYIVGERAVGA
jgi:hypothetical protein